MEQWTVECSTVHELIERRAIETPDAIAVVIHEDYLTYRQLNERANQLANFLLEKNINSQSIVGILLDRSLEMLISILGVLKSGAAYVPLDTSYPKERINFIVQDSQISFLLTYQKHIHISKDKSTTTICLDSDKEIINDCSVLAPPKISNQNTPAYILYTSGTTGQPKGVIVSHENLLSIYHSWKQAYGLTSNDKHLQMASFSFDVFAGDMLRALGSGATLVLCPREYLIQPEKLFILIQKEKITFAEFIPTILRKLTQYLISIKMSLSFMRVLICGSDTWFINEYVKLFKICKNPTTRIINSYGVTEATIDSSYFEEDLEYVKEHYYINDPVPVGKPFLNTKIYLLDEQLNQVVEGDVGEIFIAGAGVALGYHNRPELTAHKFIQNPFKDEISERLYRTGDLACRLPDGNIKFICRLDNQIKIKGIRIELSEIESMINSYPTIKESLVMVNGEENGNHPEEYGDQYIVAYMVVEQDKNLNIHELKNYLQTQLPPHMLPLVFIKLDVLPTTPNNKLDRQALKNEYADQVVRKHNAPQTIFEGKLANILMRLLGTATIGTNDYFVDLGINSLLLAKLNSEIEKNFLVKIPLIEISEALTLSELTALTLKFVNYIKQRENINA